MTTPAFNELADVLNFTEADLLANREGSMTARQLKALRRKRLGMSLVWIGVFLVASGFALFSISLLLLALTSPFRSLVDFLSLLPGIVGAGVLAAGCFYLLFTDRKQRWVAYGDDLKAGIVNCSTGQLTKGEVVGRKEHYWTISVGNEQFKINQKIFSSFEQYGFYHVYFTPHTGIMLSAERSQEPI